MRESRHKTIWNPQIAFGVIAVGVLAAVWLNMAKLRMGLGQPEHDISQIPLARNITSDQIEELRNGKPLSLILAEPLPYQRHLNASEVAGSKRLNPPQPVREVPEQTSTLFSPRDRGASGPPSAPPSDPPPSPADLRPMEDKGPDKSLETGSSALPVIAPSDVPRANPSLADKGQPGGGSFLEKFPGKSATLPNLQNGPAMKEPTPAPLRESRPQFAQASLPSASQLTPPPFGDFGPTPAAIPERQASAGGDPFVQPIAFESTIVEPAEASPIGTTEPGNVPPAAPLELPAFNRAAEPVAAADRYPTRMTREGDTWWTLAQELYDDGQLFRELYSHNRDRVPNYDEIPVGTEIVCPPAEVLRTPAPQAAKGQAQPNSSGRTYRTRAGDTLFNIAREELGQASRFGELLQQNRGRLPERTGHLTVLPEGLELKLPRR